MSLLPTTQSLSSLVSTSTRDEASNSAAGPDPILLSLFANRFMSVAEAMGRSLQQTSISTNIKASPVHPMCQGTNQPSGKRSYQQIGGTYALSIKDKSTRPDHPPCISFLQERLDFSCALFGPDGSLVANGTQ